MAHSSAWFDQFYDAYPRIEDAFLAELDESLNPRGPDSLYDYVAELGLPTGSSVLDLGSGEGAFSIGLAERFGCNVVGVDRVPRHVELAQDALSGSSVGALVRFELGTAEALPLEDASIDLIWCRDMLVHIADLEQVYRECQRVLRPGARMLVYNMFATDRLEPREAAWLWQTMGVVPSSVDPNAFGAAIAAAGLTVDRCDELGPKWGEYAQEQTGRPARMLLHAARLLRQPSRYIAKYGQAAYDIKLGDCLWHVYRMIGKLSARIYILSRPLSAERT
ncbi:MAG TPA: methyltransferase domain-containing protein [Chloroflexota bacterium]